MPTLLMSGARSPLAALRVCAILSETMPSAELLTRERELGGEAVLAEARLDGVLHARRGIAVALAHLGRDLEARLARHGVSPAERDADHEVLLDEEAPADASVQRVDRERERDVAHVRGPRDAPVERALDRARQPPGRHPGAATD